MREKKIKLIILLKIKELKGWNNEQKMKQIISEKKKKNMQLILKVRYIIHLIYFLINVVIIIGLKEVGKSTLIYT